MIFYIQRVPKRNEKNSGLREGLMNVRGEPVPQCPISVRNMKTYEYINMYYIQLV